MAFYNLPIFNLKMDWWDNSAPPHGRAPDASIFTQLYVNSKPGFAVSPTVPMDWNPPIVIRLSSSDFDAFMPPAVSSYWHWVDGAGNNWYWLVSWWERIHAGFPNEYVEMTVVQCDAFGVSPDSNR